MEAPLDDLYKIWLREEEEQRSRGRICEDGRIIIIKEILMNLRVWTDFPVVRSYEKSNELLGSIEVREFFVK
jgi:hypothetical protein